MTRRVRPADPGDIDALCRLSAGMGQTAWSRASLLRDLAGKTARFLICEEGVTPVGYVHWWHMPGEAEIMNVVVDESFRRRGIATALLRALMTKAREEGAEVVFLEVAENNTAARRLYGRLGFRTVCVREKYYAGSCENAIILQYAFVNAHG